MEKQPRYQAKCSCGWVGKQHRWSMQATQEADQHRLAELEAHQIEIDNMTRTVFT